MGDRAWWLGWLVLANAACVARVLVEDTDAGESTGFETTTSSEGTDGEVSIADSGSGMPFPPDVGAVNPPPTQRFASILFVIDDTVTMGQAQRQLRDNIVALIEPLELNEVDYRIAFTTTDNGNYWCGSDFVSQPEAGNFVSSPCLTRLFDFVSIEEVEHDVCVDRCFYEELTLIETTTAADPVPRVRPWLESVGGITNLPFDVTMDDALHCILPQGVAGCGFEQPLEAMYKAVLRAQTEGEDEYGFFHPAGLSVVIMVTDEADCSTNGAYDEIFDPEGTRIFWSNPNDGVPTSALCWNAGVYCEGLSTSLACKTENYDVNGMSGVADDAAVMQPVTRYADVLAALGNVYVAAIDGVPQGYAEGIADIVYSYDTDGQYLIDFGIGPGCTQGERRAVPTLRMQQVIEATNGKATREEYSICDVDYSVHLATIADRIMARLPL